MLEAPAPLLLVRARVKPESRDRFRQWFRAVHLRDVRRIPGIASAESAQTAGGTDLGIYLFESTDVVPGALSSPQAAYARGTWEQWSTHLEELLVEIYASLSPMPIFNSPN